VALASYQGETYYGLPALKASVYGLRIAGYLFVGGLAGFSQVLASIADLTGGEQHRSVARAGRYLALAGASISPVLLIADLHRPQRWYNMLRVFRRTSAMSLGAWTLTAFGTLSGLTALCQFWEDSSGSRRARRWARLPGLPAAGAGAVMSCYTGSLLAATSTPLWAAVPRLLPALFGTSAASTAVAALTLTLEACGVSEEEQRPLEKLALLAAGTELVLLTAARNSWKEQQIDEPLQEEPERLKFHLGVVATGVLLPLAIHGLQTLTGRRSRAATLLAAGSALLGGFLLRSTILSAGNRSARRPQDYFYFTQPDRGEILP
jgi:formate-dependent nitrite reductase membrane component NrfD